MLQYSQLLKFQRSSRKIRLGCSGRPGGPGGPRLLVGLAEKADVVDLEPRRAPLVGGLEPEPVAADLREAELEIRAAERSAGGIERQWPVGALVQMDSILLGQRDRRLAAGHPAEIERPRHLEPAANRRRASIPPVYALRWRYGSVERSSERFTAVAMKPRLRVAVREVLIAAHDRVVRGGLQRRPVGTGDIVGDGVQHAERESAGQPAGHLRRRRGSGSRWATNRRRTSRRAAASGRSGGSRTGPRRCRSPPRRRSSR